MVVETTLSRTFKSFFDSEKAGGVVLILATIVSLLVANSTLGTPYLKFWHTPFAGLSVEQWTNDGLMAVFFLLIGLELRRELSHGELSDTKRALLPVFAALGGICLPALIHLALNARTETQAGVGIPIATDIAFALGVLAILGSRIPATLKVFLTALAVMDDLGAILVIAFFYTTQLSVAYLGGALALFVLLLALSRFARVMSLTPYLLGGALMWYLMLRSGVHATIAGVLLAWTIPMPSNSADEDSPSHRLERWLSRPVAFLIMPVFALANTGIKVESSLIYNLNSPNSLGIIYGLVFGKPFGILLFSFVVVKLGLCRLPSDLNWRHILGAGLLGGIGFTMSIFITNLAFNGNGVLIDTAKIAILLASLTSGLLGLLWLRFFTTIRA
jgi:NhaA family Na+:H+ antiporter